MKLKYKKDLDENILGTNPLQTNLLIPIVNISKKSTFRVDEEGYKLPLTVDLEYTPYCKLFTKAEHRKIIANLTPKARSLFLYIGYVLEHGKDYVWITPSKYTEEWHCSLNTFKKALTELARYQIICYSHIEHVYWINPDYLFKGNRMKKYPDKTITLDIYNKLIKQKKESQ